MSSGTFYTVPLPENPMRLLKKPDVYDIRTVDQHIAQLERDIARLQQQIADQGMMIAQLREIVTGEPPFLQPSDDWRLNE